jgi:hypothetical protein
MSERALGSRQREWLLEIAEDGYAHWMDGLYAYAFMPKTMETVPNRVLFSLEDRGLVERYRDPLSHRTVVRLTEAGWEMVEKLRGKR